MQHFFFAANFLAGLAGFGFRTYSYGRTGIKGFFYAGNELSIVVFCMFVYWFIRNQNKILTFFIFIAISLFTGTKAAIFGTVLYYLLYMFYYRPRKYMHKFFVLLGVVIIFLLSRNYILNINVIRYQINNIEWRLNQTGASLLDVLLSGRLSFLDNLFSNARKNFSFTSVLIGFGVPYKSVEIDIFDTFYSYGALVGILITAFYVCVMIKSRKNKNIFYFNLIYLLLSLTAGHVWFNTTSAILFCIINIQEVQQKNGR